MKKSVSFVVLAAIMGLGHANAQSFCNESHSGTSVTKTANATGTIGDVGYEIWFEEGTNSATFYSDGSFYCSFSSTSDYLCRSGNSYNSDKKYTELGHLYADFSVNISNTSNVGYSYIGVYGWTKSPLIEYYIVDNWGSEYRPGSWVGTLVGTFTIDGAEYDVYTNTRTNAPSIEGTTTFTQFFSIRKTARSCGTIDITAHFDAWAEQNMELGYMYEAKILGEAGNVSGGASGEFDFPYAKVYTSDTESSSSSVTSSSSSVASSSSETEITRSPYGGVAATIPGTIEAENFDNGNNNVSYYDASTAEEEGGNYDYRGSEYYVDVVGTSSGYAVGYTTSEEWLEYTVNVTATGNYNVVAYLANGSSAGSLALLIDGTQVGTIAFEQTTDWNTYETFSTTVSLTEGEHILRVAFETSYTNFDKLVFTAEDEILGIKNSLAYDGFQGETAVFDMQGRMLGSIYLNKGVSVKDALFEKFKTNGLYLLKQKNNLIKVKVNR